MFGDCKWVGRGSSCACAGPLRSNKLPTRSCLSELLLCPNVGPARSGAVGRR